jgi:chromosome segregation ATPase
MVALLANVPVRAALFDDTEARRQIAAERKRVDDLSSKLTEQTQQLEAVAGRLGKVEEGLGKNQAVLDLFREIESLKSEIAKMRGQMEVLTNGISTAQKRQQDFYVDLDTRLRRLESPPVPAAAGAPPAVGDASTPAGKPGPGGGPPPGAASTAVTRA